MTDADRHAHVTVLFHQALEHPTAERADWLARVCDDTGVRTQVAAMLTQEASGSFLDEPLLARDGTDDPLLGETVGPWRVVSLLGRGGMGAVYRAERADASFHQTAALKLVHPGVGRDFHARFLHERSLLASLDHPGIARVLDGGVGASGRPYLAMELVEGEPITAYADARALDVPARLALVLDACDAVAYAHRNLVVHRDLKPDHVLVEDGGPGNGERETRTVDHEVDPADSDSAHRALHPSSPRVKLLDFGVAKLLGDDDPALTRTGTGPLTPSYAAPEQLLGRAVTTATDVYALGIVLYEVLAGRRPYDVAGLTASQTEQVVCEADPPPPSSVAPEAAARALRGDLDAVVLKALAKEPERRYASAEALADDLRRHLDELPVRARPATTRYRVGRFVRRHRLGVLATAATVALVALLSTIYAVRLTDERNRARDQAERAEAVSDFLESILRAPNAAWYVASEAKGPDTPISAVLDEAAARVDRDFADRPDLRADLHHIIGDTYDVLGDEETSLYHARIVLAIRESLYTAPHPKIAEAIFYVGRVTPDFMEALRLHEQAAEMLRQRPGGNNYPFILNFINGSYDLAGFHDEAEAISLETYAFARDNFTLGTDGYQYRAFMMRGPAVDMAAKRLRAGDLEGAGRWLQRAEETGAQEDAWHRCVRGQWYLATGRVHEAEREYARCGAMEQSHKAQGLDFGWLSVRLVEFYDGQGRPDLGDPFRDEAEATLALYDSLTPLLRAHFAKQE